MPEREAVGAQERRTEGVMTGRGIMKEKVRDRPLPAPRRQGGGLEKLK